MKCLNCYLEMYDSTYWSSDYILDYILPFDECCFDCKIGYNYMSTSKRDNWYFNDTFYTEKELEKVLKLKAFI